MKIFNIETGEPALLDGSWDWAAVVIKWDDDRGRGFDEVSNFKNSDGWIEFDYRHPEAGKAHIRINEYGIRWIEFFETKPELDNDGIKNRAQGQL